MIVEAKRLARVDRGKRLGVLLASMVIEYNTDGCWSTDTGLDGQECHASCCAEVRYFIEGRMIGLFN